VHLERVLEINPRRADAHHNLGAALGSQGKLDDALRHANEALKIRPDSPDAQTDRILIRELEQEKQARDRK
jgi:tetratricopeptide (TPR) repeat protein